ncbi:FAD-binding oxidoreductase [Microbacterium sp. LRZ72]|uniref:FAD-binding oxidoreductase n=1 Tax=Microbacterium sp. LRZ72 TaxID=2942481 RepID=UPI0029A76958|nr:FAD-binding oxidoreductase [Microbacterium sp. LRZ72]MDX2377552.1 FAD-binding oxidoreductase [Microbacterium sp. LRZ72]
MEITYTRPALPQTVVQSLIEALGADAVLTQSEEVDTYRDPYWLPGDDTYIASAVVEPTSTEQVQAVMRIANSARVPVWPVSQGRNNGYGGPSPRVAGSIQVSLRKMNKVLEINEDLAYAVVEPGVRWIDLHAALEAGNHNLAVSVPDIGWGSVIGNALDNGITYMPNGTDFATLTGFEIVLADGEILRTGMGAQPGNKAWHVYKRSLGPALDALFTQSNFGIVVRAGVMLQRKPEAFRTMILALDKDSDLEAGMVALRELMLDGTLRGVPCMYPAPRSGAMLDDAEVPQPRPWTEEEIEQYGRETGLGRWGVRVGLWEDAEIMEYKTRKIAERWTQIPGARIVRAGRVYTPEEYGEITLTAEKNFAGIPSMFLVEKTPPGIGHIGFSPVVANDPDELRKVIDAVRHHLGEAGILHSGGVYFTSARSCVVVTGIQFDTRNEEAVRNAFDVTKRLIVEVGKLGYGEYRAHLDIMELASDQYSFNDHIYRRFAEKIKDAVDPNGIIAPGRHGVWPGGQRPLERNGVA